MVADWQQGFDRQNSVISLGSCASLWAYFKAYTYVCVCVGRCICRYVCILPHAYPPGLVVAERVYT